MASFGLDLSGLGSASFPRKWNLQKAYNWMLFMPHIFGGTLGYLVSQYCQDVVFGDYSITEMSTLKYGAFQRFYAGLQSIDTVTLLFLVPTDNSVMDYFYAWYERVVDRDGYYYPKSYYKRTIYLMLQDPSGVETVRFKLKGCFPKSHPTIHPSYTDEGIMIAQITLSVDDVDPSGLLGTIKDIRGAITETIAGLFS